MNATPYRRYLRKQRIEALLPPVGAAAIDCRDAAWLLQQLDSQGEDYYGAAGPDARLRALQRDLKDLVKEERIEAVNPRSKPLRYRRRGEDLNDDPMIWADTLRQIRDLVGGVVKARQIDRLWQQLPKDADVPLLDGERLRIVPDSLRLQPPVVAPDVVTAVIAALSKGEALEVDYENADGERKQARIHPQALVQRGPVPYLFALKNDETAPVRLYALHRMRRARVLSGVAARRAKGFTLDGAIADGKVDFGQGERIRLVLMVRGYLAPFLQDCWLSADQDVTVVQEEPELKLRVVATVPASGQLLRWLLGAGDKLEVLEPADLRHTVAVQAAKMAALYAEPPPCGNSLD